MHDRPGREQQDRRVAFAEHGVADTHPVPLDGALMIWLARAHNAPRPLSESCLTRGGAILRRRASQLLLHAAVSCLPGECFDAGSPAWVASPGSSSGAVSTAYSGASMMRLTPAT